MTEYISPERIRILDHKTLSIKEKELKKHLNYNFEPFPSMIRCTDCSGFVCSFCGKCHTQNCEMESLCLFQ